MQETLHLFSANAFPNHNFPSKPINFPPFYCPRNLHFPTISSTKTTISLPPKPPKIPETPSISPTPQPHLNPTPQSEFHESLLYLDSIGIDLFSLLTTHPSIVSTSITDVKSIIHLLHSAGLTAPDLRRVLSMCPELLTSNISDIVQVLTFLLREAQVDGSDLRRVINRRPRLLACSVEKRLRPTMYFLQSIGITQIKRHTSLLSCSVEQKFIPRIEYLQRIGFSYRDAISMFRRFPPLFCYSIEENFEPKFDYFVVEMGRELKELKEFPHYFSFSLENRIKPRHRQCMEKGVCLSLPAMLKSSEERFGGRLEVFCNSSIPVSTSPLWVANYDANSLYN
ncbi:transcription termination factor MTEF1, chloroplastic [Cornus florida]|uniref:transcription termination factor MTEF1, chloroplastic n=1 Tax=Cornus florida TaxID=4283 RepID=UPI00289911EE|nr:transcription termination factor MTEF1, chloroplastic [Cornus florida]